MAFSVKDWQDAPSTTSPITAVALEDMETRLSGYTDSELVTHTADSTSVHGISDTANLVYTTDSRLTSARTFNVESTTYGAVADAYYADGVSTASTTFTSATAAFTAADVGKTIHMIRAGDSTLQDRTTTIASVTNSTTVELTQATSTARTNCRFYISRAGGQSAAIQAAINAAAAAGGGVVLCPGVGYLIDTTLTLKHRVVLKGTSGRATMLHAVASLNSPVVTNDQTTDNSAMFCEIRDIWIDGNRKNQTNLSTTLSAGYTAGGTTLSLTSATGFPNAGSVLIGTNRLIYTSKSGNTLSGVVGGSEGTTDANASNGAAVTGYSAHGISLGVVPASATPTDAEYYDPHWLIDNVIVRNCKGYGIENWGQSDLRLRSTWVSYCENIGIRTSYDASLVDVVSDNHGRACYHFRSSDVKATNCKAFFGGASTAAEGWGFLVEGPTTSEEGQKILSSCTAQDNKAEGYYFRNAERVNAQIGASSNGTSSAGTYAGIKIDGSSHGIIDAVCTERVAAPNNTQQNALEIKSTLTSANNLQIRVTHAETGSSAVGPPIKSGSVLTSGVHVTVNGMGGSLAVAAASGSLTPDPYNGDPIYALTGNITALNAPAVALHYGMTFKIVFVQDVVGSRTLSGANAVYKWSGGSAPTLTVTASRRDTFWFWSDGTNCYETARSLNVG